MKSRRVYITLNPKRDEDRRVLDYLQNAGCPSGKAVTIAVLDYLDRQKQGGEYTELLQAVRDTIQDCFQSMSVHDMSRESQVSAAEIDDESVSPLDFIDAMTGGCSFP